MKELKAYTPLASGFDTIVIAIDVKWKDKTFFEYLEELKTLAVKEEKETAVAISDPKTQETIWMGVIKPHGTKGYEWNLSNSDFSMLIGKWSEPRSRPSIMVHISSEAIWRSGPREIVSFLLKLIELAGGIIISAKASRIDLSLDLTFPRKKWNAKLIEHRVTRANYAAPHFFNITMTGISIGKGNLSARLYDKPLEIQQKSNKIWMFDIWNIESLPDHLLIVRIEFQIRREVIKDLGLNSIESVFDCCENLWAYCTKRWLKFQNNTGKHHTQRKTFRWWKVVQDNFLGVQNAHPLIRCKSINPQKDQLSSQAYGAFRSFIALRSEELELPMNYDVTSKKAIRHLLTFIKEKDLNDFILSMDVNDKRSKYHRATEKLIKANVERAKHGFPEPVEDTDIMKILRKK